MDQNQSTNIISNGGGKVRGPSLCGKGGLSTTNCKRDPEQDSLFVCEAVDNQVVANKTGPLTTMPRVCDDETRIRSLVSCGFP